MKPAPVGRHAVVVRRHVDDLQAGGLHGVAGRRVAGVLEPGGVAVVGQQA